MGKLDKRTHILGDNEIEVSLWEEIVWTVEAWIDRVRDKIREVRWFFQRGKRGYAYSDTWSLDWYLVSWLPDALRELRDREMGYPCGVTEDVDTPEKWHEELTVMIEGFEAASKILNTYPDEEEHEELQKTFDKGMKKFHKHFFDLWD